MITFGVHAGSLHGVKRKSAKGLCGQVRKVIIYGHLDLHKWVGEGQFGRVHWLLQIVWTRLICGTVRAAFMEQPIFIRMRK